MIELIATWIGYAVMAGVVAGAAWLIWELLIWSLICACSNTRFLAACARASGDRMSFLAFVGIVWRRWIKFAGFRKGSLVTRSKRCAGEWHGVGDWWVKKRADRFIGDDS